MSKDARKFTAPDKIIYIHIIYSHLQNRQHAK